MPLANTPWPKVGCDLQNTNRSPYVCTADGTITKTIALPEGNHSVRYGGGIIIGDNVLYLRNRAYNLDGTLKWESSMDMGSFYKGTPLLLSNGVLCQGIDKWSDDGKAHLYYIDAQNGNVLAEYTYTGVLASPQSITVAQTSEDNKDVLIIPCQNDIWGWYLDGSAQWSIKYLSPPDGPSTAAAVDTDGNVYIGATYTSPYTQHSHVFRLGLASGTKTSLASYKYRYIRSSIAIHNGLLYFMNEDGLCMVEPFGDGTAYILDTDVFWEYQGTNLAISSDGIIYIPTYGGVYRYVINSGPLSKLKCSEPDVVILDADNRVYVNGAALRCYSPLGELLWEVPDFYVSAMAIGEDGTLYVVHDHGDNICELCILGEVAPPSPVEPPYISTASIGCAIPWVEFEAPTTDNSSNMHFKLESFAEAGGVSKIDTVDSSLNPERFYFMPKNGATWQAFPASGLPSTQGGVTVRARVAVGPRRKVWLRASVQGGG